MFHKLEMQLQAFQEWGKEKCHAERRWHVEVKNSIKAPKDVIIG